MTENLHRLAVIMLKYCLCTVVQEEDVDDDTLTTDTVSPEANGSNSQVVSHSSPPTVSVILHFPECLSTTITCVCVCSGADAPA